MVFLDFLFGNIIMKNPYKNKFNFQYTRISFYLYLKMYWITMALLYSTCRNNNWYPWLCTMQLTLTISQSFLSRMKTDGVESSPRTPIKNWLNSIAARIIYETFALIRGYHTLKNVCGGDPFYPPICSWHDIRAYFTYGLPLLCYVRIRPRIMSL